MWLTEAKRRREEVRSGRVETIAGEAVLEAVRRLVTHCGFGFIPKPALSIARPRSITLGSGGEGEREEQRGERARGAAGGVVQLGLVITEAARVALLGNEEWRMVNDVADGERRIRAVKLQMEGRGAETLGFEI